MKYKNDRYSTVKKDYKSLTKCISAYNITGYYYVIPTYIYF